MSIPKKNIYIAVVRKEGSQKKILTNTEIRHYRISDHHSWSISAQMPGPCSGCQEILVESPCVVDSRPGERGKEGDGVTVANSLRIDGNEMITNTGNTLYLQHDNNGDLRVDNSTLVVDASANRVGIGTTAPETTLDVNGDIKMYQATFDGWLSNYSGMTIKTYVMGTQSRWFDIKDNNGALYARFNSDDDSLSVDGPVRAGDFIVDVSLADYVFDTGYDLKSLEETESFIKANKHLPDMPSAADVDANGLGLADFNNPLLQKVEELTLHVIEQNKQIKNLQKQVSAKK